MATATKTATEIGVFDKLKAICWEHIEAFENDLLVHDKAMIEEHPGVPFLHWTRASGTHMVMLLPTEQLSKAGEVVPYLFGTADRKHVAKGAVSIAEHCAGPDRSMHKVVLHFDGKSFHRITVERAVTIAKDYYYGLLSEWGEAKRG